MINLLSTSLIAFLTLFPTQTNRTSPDTKTAPPVESMEFKLCHATYPLKCTTINGKDTLEYFKLITPQVPSTLKRMRAIDKKGREGFASPWLQFVK